MSQLTPSIPIIHSNEYICSLCVEARVESALFDIISLINHGGRVHGVQHVELDVFIKKSMSLDRSAVTSAHDFAPSSAVAVDSVARLDPQVETFMADDIASISNNNYRCMRENDGDATNQAVNAEFEHDVGSPMAIESGSRENCYVITDTAVVPQQFPNMATCDSCRKDGRSCEFISFGKPCLGCKDNDVCRVNHISFTELWEKFSRENADKADLMVRFEEMFAFEEKREEEDGWMAMTGY